MVTATPPRPPRSAELAAGRCRGGDGPRDGHIPFTPVAKHILELTLRETRALPDPLGRNQRGQAVALVGISFGVLVDVQRAGVIEERAVAFGNRLELGQEVGELLDVPAVDVAHDPLAFGRFDAAVRVLVVPLIGVAEPGEP